MWPSLIPSLLVLGVAAIAAMGLAMSRPSPATHTSSRQAAARALIVALVVQGIHFGEEAITDFPARLGGLLGLPAMPMSFFLAFNLVWLGIWIVSVPGVQSARTLAFFAAWFLAIAGMFNAIAHPLLALASGGYFPGLVSSPFIGAAGVSLWRRLRAATRAGAA
jgi:hypothetical protein